MLINVTKTFNISAAHRLLGHPGGCAHLHGHNYVIGVTLCATNTKQLDPLGMVVDFGKIKEVIGGWLNNNWDHATLLNSRDPLVKTLSDDLGQRVYVFHGKNPTAEVMAATILSKNGLLPDGIRIVKVTVEETPGSTATAYAGD